MKKIKRKLRLHGLKFYLFTGNGTYWVSDKSIDLRSLVKYQELHGKIILLRNQQLHDMLVEFSSGNIKSVFLLNYGEYKKYNYIYDDNCFEEYKTVEDLVNATYRIELIESLSGL